MRRHARGISRVRHFVLLALISTFWFTSVATGQTHRPGPVGDHKIDDPNAPLEFNPLMSPAEIRRTQAENARRAHVKANEELKSSIESRSSYRALLVTPSSLFGLLSDRDIDKELAISPEQKRRIEQLRDVLRVSLRSLILAEREALELPEANRDQFLRASAKTQQQIILHVDDIALTGILTESQVNKIKQGNWKRFQSLALLESEVANYLQLTKFQRLEIAQLQAMAKETAASSPILGTTDASAQQAAYDEHRERLSASRADIWTVLTPAQCRRWQDLTTKKFPVAPPRLSLPAADGDKEQLRLKAIEAEIAEIQKKPLSMAFRILLDPAQSDAVKLSNDQRMQIENLDSIARIGLVQILIQTSDDLSKTDRAHAANMERNLKVRSEFLKHVEQVLVSGLLDKPQSERLATIAEER
ncbi:MAG: hypothetical protein JWN86_4343 [Planctomycetota bacterium]|nr:hypothetical protein [Planctomycetota bacterium]